MKKLGKNGIKILKICHLIFVMIWVVGVISMGVVGLIKATSGDELYMKLYTTRIIDDALVIPGAVLTVVTAILYGVYTNWGFFKYKWITVKWIVSFIVIIVGTFYCSPLLNNIITITNSDRLSALYNVEVNLGIKITLVFTIIQSSILIFLIIISIFKPWKKTNKHK